LRRTTCLIAAIALLAGCDREPTVSRDTPAPARPTTSFGSAVERDLATLRQVTAALHDTATSNRAGWSARITKCMQLSGEGGMGFHYGNPGLIDGVARVNEPEVLLFEPEKNGTLRLVAVEYVIPYALHSREAEPPVLFGQQFKQNDAFKLWGLHAWVWKDNPSGMFADWNPTVNCDNTTEIEGAMAQH
jgi:hypothetical protein